MAWPTFNIDGASYSNKTVTLTSQAANCVDFDFKSDGTKFYFFANTNKAIYQYSLSTAWDVSTASYDSKYITVDTSDNQSAGMFFKSDGTKLIIVGSVGSYTYLMTYTLSTAWDVSTATKSSQSHIEATVATPKSLFVKSDGLKLFISSTNNKIYQFTLSTAWDVSTASYDSKSFDTSTQLSTCIGIYFKDNGSKVYSFGLDASYSIRAIYQYSLSTAWDISTASYDSKYFSVQSQISGGTSGLKFKPDNGEKFYCGTTSCSFFQYLSYVSTNIKSKNGLAKASIKSYNGLASPKSINGLS